MTATEILMIILSVIVIGSYLLTWLILSREQINRKACRTAYKLSRWFDDMFVCLSDDYPEECPEWADEAKWEESKI